MNEIPADTELLLERAAAGDDASWGALLQRHHQRLGRMVAVRLNSRLQGRVDSQDVLQEVFVQALAARDDYLERRPAPFFLWLRGIAGNVLLTLHRRHLGTEMRDAAREIRLDRGPMPEASSFALAAWLVGHDTRPSEAAVRAERRRRMQEALDLLAPLDREVLALRHYEQLQTAEVADVLGITPAAAGKRYLRALERLRDVLRDLPGGLEGLAP
jgi:RNA polymerase sigma-70 factor (ECF subfamily)